MVLKWKTVNSFTKSLIVCALKDLQRKSLAAQIYTLDLKQGNTDWTQRKHTQLLVAKRDLSPKSILL